MKKILIILGSIMGCSLAQADVANSGWYIGAGSGFSTTTNSNTTLITGSNAVNQTFTPISNNSGNAVPISVDAGYQFNNLLSIEGMYNHINSDFTSLNNSGEQNIYSLSAVGTFPVLSNVNIKARVGASLYDTNINGYLGNVSTIKPTDLLGAGIQYRFIKNISLDFDYLYYGLLFPINMNYQPCSGCQSLSNNNGIANQQTTSIYLLSVQYHF